VKGCQLPKATIGQLLDHDDGIGNQQSSSAEVVQPHDWMQARDVRNPTDDIDQVGTPPAQLLREVLVVGWRGTGPADSIHGAVGFVARLNNLTSEETVLAVLDRDAQDVPVFKNGLKLKEHGATVSSQTP